MGKDNRVFTNNNKHGFQNNNNGDGAQTNNTLWFHVTKHIGKAMSAAKAVFDNRSYLNRNEKGTQNNNNGDGFQANGPNNDPRGNQNVNNGDGIQRNAASVDVPKKATNVNVPGHGGTREEADNRKYKNKNSEMTQNNNIGRGTLENSDGSRVPNRSSDERGNARGDNRTYQNENSQGAQNNNNGDGTLFNQR